MNYLVVGNGRLAKHLLFYLQSLRLPVQSWTRNAPESLESKIKSDTRVLLTLPDDALDGFLKLHPALLNKKTVQFSGVRHISEISNAHPLMTFGPNLYDNSFYKKIPFVLTKEDPRFSEIMPGLPNPHYSIDRNKKSLYHALCVFSGNFSTLLWENTARLMSKELGLPAEALNPYLERTNENLKQLFANEKMSFVAEKPASVLTGPLVRKDMSTLVRNIDSLVNRPEQDLYYAFLNYFFATQGHVEGDSYERPTV